MLPISELFGLKISYFGPVKVENFKISAQILIYRIWTLDFARLPLFGESTKWSVLGSVAFASADRSTKDRPSPPLVHPPCFQNSNYVNLCRLLLKKFPSLGLSHHFFRSLSPVYRIGLRLRQNLSLS